MFINTKNTLILKSIGNERLNQKSSENQYLYIAISSTCKSTTNKKVLIDSLNCRLR